MMMMTMQNFLNRKN